MIGLGFGFRVRFCFRVRCHDLVIVLGFRVRCHGLVIVLGFVFRLGVMVW